MRGRKIINKLIIASVVGILLILLAGLQHGCRSYLGNAKTKSEPAQEAQIVVHDRDSFMKALGPNRTILLKNGEYIFDRGITISFLSGLKLKGEDRDKVRIIVKERYDDVLTLKDVTNVSISNITFGHEPAGYCLGGVIISEASRDILLDNVVLFGSGVEGLTLANVDNLTLSNSTIRNCTYQAMSVVDSIDIKIINSTIRENAGMPNFHIVSSQVLFDNSLISPAEELSGPLFDLDNKNSISWLFDAKGIRIMGEGPSQVKLSNCTISGKYYPAHNEEGDPEDHVDTSALISNKPHLVTLINTNLDISEVKREEPWY